MKTKQHKSQGNFAENQTLPRNNQLIYAVIGFDQKVTKGRVQKTTNIDNKGIANTYVDVIVNDKNYHLSINQVYDHKPEKVIVNDIYGAVTIWE